MDLLTRFKHYLLSQNYSASSIKNYLSDIRKFLKSQSLRVSQGLTLKPIDFQNYIFSLSDHAHRRRYLSSLKKFAQFLNLDISSPVMSANQIRQQNLLDEFGQNLHRAGLSRVTVANYLSDVRQYLEWRRGAS